ncbi:microtubule-associated protein futsch-like [Amphibalanus amphitrite]|uniref:microtubule-associated protein futsch-like n=1 Tax=Amphibalanus amphitrite TaxID=1232801 RepID=UPI001C90EF01|nr:microtubule-associated protein futsch-like [Amphibalanus amphitrite]
MDSGGTADSGFSSVLPATAQNSKQLTANQSSQHGEGHTDSEHNNLFSPTNGNIPVGKENDELLSDLSEDLKDVQISFGKKELDNGFQDAFLGNEIPEYRGGDLFSTQVQDDADSDTLNANREHVEALSSRFQDSNPFMDLGHLNIPKSKEPSDNPRNDRDNFLSSISTENSNDQQKLFSEEMGMSQPQLTNQNSGEEDDKIDLNDIDLAMPETHSTNPFSLGDVFGKTDVSMENQGDEADLIASHESEATPTSNSGDYRGLVDFDLDTKDSTPNEAADKDSHVLNSSAELSITNPFTSGNFGNDAELTKDRNANASSDISEGVDMTSSSAPFYFKQQEDEQQETDGQLSESLNNQHAAELTDHRSLTNPFMGNDVEAAKAAVSLAGTAGVSETDYVREEDAKNQTLDSDIHLGDAKGESEVKDVHNQTTSLDVIEKDSDAENLSTVGEPLVSASMGDTADGNLPLATLPVPSEQSETESSLHARESAAASPNCSDLSAEPLPTNEKDGVASEQATERRGSQSATGPHNSDQPVSASEVLIHSPAASSGSTNVPLFDFKEKDINKDLDVVTKGDTLVGSVGVSLEGSKTAQNEASFREVSGAEEKASSSTESSSSHEKRDDHGYSFSLENTIDTEDKEGQTGAESSLTEAYNGKEFGFAAEKRHEDAIQVNELNFMQDVNDDEKYSSSPARLQEDSLTGMNGGATSTTMDMESLHAEGAKEHVLQDPEHVLQLSNAWDEEELKQTQQKDVDLTNVGEESSVQDDTSEHPQSEPLKSVVPMAFDGAAEDQTATDTERNESSVNDIMAYADTEDPQSAPNEDTELPEDKGSEEGAQTDAEAVVHLEEADSGLEHHNQNENERGVINGNTDVVEGEIHRNTSSENYEGMTDFADDRDSVRELWQSEAMSLQEGEPVSRDNIDTITQGSKHAETENSHDKDLPSTDGLERFTVKEPIDELQDQGKSHPNADALRSAGSIDKGEKLFLDEAKETAALSASDMHSNSLQPEVDVKLDDVSSREEGIQSSTIMSEGKPTVDHSMAHSDVDISSGIATEMDMQRSAEQAELFAEPLHFSSDNDTSKTAVADLDIDEKPSDADAVAESGHELPLAAKEKPGNENFKQKEDKQSPKLVNDAPLHQEPDDMLEELKSQEPSGTDLSEGNISAVITDAIFDNFDQKLLDEGHAQSQDLTSPKDQRADHEQTGLVETLDRYAGEVGDVGNSSREKEERIEEPRQTDDSISKNDSASEKQLNIDSRDSHRKDSEELAEERISEAFEHKHMDGVTATVPRIEIERAGDDNDDNDNELLVDQSGLERKSEPEHTLSEEDAEQVEAAEPPHINLDSDSDSGEADQSHVEDILANGDIGEQKHQRNTQADADSPMSQTAVPQNAVLADPTTTSDVTAVHENIVVDGDDEIISDKTRSSEESTGVEDYQEKLTKDDSEGIHRKSTEENIDESPFAFHEPSKPENELTLSDQDLTKKEPSTNRSEFQPEENTGPAMLGFTKENLPHRVHKGAKDALSETLPASFERLELSHEEDAPNEHDTTEHFSKSSIPDRVAAEEVSVTHNDNDEQDIKGNTSLHDSACAEEVEDRIVSEESEGHMIQPEAEKQTICPDDTTMKVEDDASVNMRVSDPKVYSTEDVFQDEIHFDGEKDTTLESSRLTEGSLKHDGDIAEEIDHAISSEAMDETQGGDTDSVEQQELLDNLLMDEHDAVNITSLSEASTMPHDESTSNVDEPDAESGPFVASSTTPKSEVALGASTSSEDDAATSHPLTGGAGMMGSDEMLGDETLLAPKVSIDNGNQANEVQPSKASHSEPGQCDESQVAIGQLETAVGGDESSSASGLLAGGEPLTEQNDMLSNPLSDHRGGELVEAAACVGMPSTVSPVNDFEATANSLTDDRQEQEPVDLLLESQSQSADENLASDAQENQVGQEGQHASAGLDAAAPLLVAHSYDDELAVGKVGEPGRFETLPDVLDFTEQRPRPETVDIIQPTDFQFSDSTRDDKDIHDFDSSMPDVVLDPLSLSSNAEEMHGSAQQDDEPTSEGSSRDVASKSLAVDNISSRRNNGEADNETSTDHDSHQTIDNVMEVQQVGSEHEINSEEVLNEPPLLEASEAEVNFDDTEVISKSQAPDEAVGQRSSETCSTEMYKEEEQHAIERDSLARDSDTMKLIAEHDSGYEQKNPMHQHPYVSGAVKEETEAATGVDTSHHNQSHQLDDTVCSENEMECLDSMNNRRTSLEDTATIEQDVRAVMAETRTNVDGPTMDNLSKESAIEQATATIVHSAIPGDADHLYLTDFGNASTQNYENSSLEKSKDKSAASSDEIDIQEHDLENYRAPEVTLDINSHAEVDALRPGLDHLSGQERENLSEI